MPRLLSVALGYGIIYAWVWPIRSRGDFDLPRDKVCRDVWLLGTLALLGAGAHIGRPIPPGTPSDTWSLLTAAYTASPVGATLILASQAFFVWPNFAVHTTRFLRWLHILPPAHPEYQRALSEQLGKPMRPTP